MAGDEVLRRTSSPTTCQTFTSFFESRAAQIAASQGGRSSFALTATSASSSVSEEMRGLACAIRSTKLSLDWRTKPDALCLLVVAKQDVAHRQCAGEVSCGTDLHKVCNPPCQAATLASLATCISSCRSTPPRSWYVTWTQCPSRGWLFDAGFDRFDRRDDGINEHLAFVIRPAEEPRVSWVQPELRRVVRTLRTSSNLPVATGSTDSGISVGSARLRSAETKARIDAAAAGVNNCTSSMPIVRRTLRWSC
eukprot:6002852-Prymnesium_polylepis.2